MLVECDLGATCTEVAAGEQAADRHVDDVVVTDPHVAVGEGEAERFECGVHRRDGGEPEIGLRVGELHLLVEAERLEQDEPAVG